MQKIKELTFLKFLLSCVDRGYIKKIKFKKSTANQINLVLEVKSKEFIRCLHTMIEANLITNKELHGVSYNLEGNKAYIGISDGTQYTLKIV